MRSQGALIEEHKGKQEREEVSEQGCVCRQAGHYYGCCLIDPIVNIDFHCDRIQNHLRDRPLGYRALDLFTYLGDANQGGRPILIVGRTIPSSEDPEPCEMEKGSCPAVRLHCPPFLIEDMIWKLLQVSLQDEIYIKLGVSTKPSFVKSLCQSVFSRQLEKQGRVGPVGSQSPPKYKLSGVCAGRNVCKEIDTPIPEFIWVCIVIELRKGLGLHFLHMRQAGWQFCCFSAWETSLETFGGFPESCAVVLNLRVTTPVGTACEISLNIFLHILLYSRYLHNNL